MAEPYVPRELRFGGGLNLVDAPDALVARSQTRQAENFRLTGAGWLSSRRAALRVGNAITDYVVIAGPFPFNHSSGVGGVQIEWNPSTGVMRLVTLDGSGGNHTVIGNLPGYQGVLGYGSDLIANGDFASGASWSLGGNAEISTGTLHLNPVSGGGTASQTLTPTPGRRYRVTYTIAGRTNGEVTGSFGGTALTTRSTNGTFVEIVEAVAATGLSLIITSTSPAFDGTIDDVSVELEDFSLAPEIVAAVLGRVLFMCDTAREKGLVIYDPNNVLGGATKSATFNSGGATEPTVGQVLVGATSAATAVLQEKTHVSGTWAGGDEVGSIKLALAGATGVFQNGENLNIQGGASNVLTLTSAFSNDAILYQPTFDFNGDGTYAVATPRVVLEHENHLHMFGYGDESEPNRGEVWRFSYLGLLDDGQGSADAGAWSGSQPATARVGSSNLFDTTDTAPAGARGCEVVSAGSAPGRLAYATEGPHRYSVIYGSGRDTWNRLQIDSERGSSATRGMCEADGVIYHWSPLGPCFFAGGGQLIDISRPIDPRTEEMDLSSLIATHVPQLNQVRWYYRRRGDVVPGCDRWVGWNYLNQGYEEDVLGYRVFSAGWLLPSGAEAPTAAPSGLTHEAIGRKSARAVWTPGDTAPGVVTRVHRKIDGGSYVQVGELKQGGREFPHVGLVEDTTYWTKVEHVRNGQLSSYDEESFTTLALPVVPPPINVQAIDSPFLLDTGWTPSALVTWDSGGYDPTSTRHIVEKQVSGGGWVNVLGSGSLSPGQFYWRDIYATENDLHEYRIRAVDAEGIESANSSTASVTPSLEPYAGWPEDQVP